MVMLALPLPLDAKAAPLYMPSVSVPPLMVPKSNVTVVAVPSPMAAVLLVCPAATRFCDCASLLTFTLYVPGTAVLPAVAESTLASDGVAATFWKLVARVLAAV